MVTSRIEMNSVDSKIPYMEREIKRNDCVTNVGIWSFSFMHNLRASGV